ncbi:divergent PAP2 family protein [Niameybacter massiliensis]|uniref:Divergent PAP2 family protein n=1 Tax=Holtiella tumoricola TaxID=3018743 RepID=A0AA42DR67_9FIRM|nr:MULTISPECIES: divergent PAP2 family protein [Lachnospirales]MDA3733763.1 divergent PAP2 family protein [Holtiella tumoricola]
MRQFTEIMDNRILFAALLSWLVAQVLKVVLTLVNEHRLDFHKLISSGGMPSSHSAISTSLAIGVGQLYGYDSALFAIAAVLSFIVMYDAANVRLEAGKQAALLNRIIDVMQDPNVTMEVRLKELLGHTPLQVAAGAVLGIVVALILIP